MISSLRRFAPSDNQLLTDRRLKWSINLRQSSARNFSTLAQFSEALARVLRFSASLAMAAFQAAWSTSASISSQIGDYARIERIEFPAFGGAVSLARRLGRRLPL